MRPASTFDMSLLDDLAVQMGPDNPSWSPLYDLLKASLKRLSRA